MGHITLITGGSRSGKSGFAQRLAEALPAPRVFAATCRVEDDEMAARVARHQAARAGQDWRTVEEPLHLAAMLQTWRESGVVLVDCLTIWIANLMQAAYDAGRDFGEDDMASACVDLLVAAKSVTGHIILVTNEVGMGIVPENALARRFRDLAGRAGQVVAAGADEVYLVACGIPMKIKG